MSELPGKMAYMKKTLLVWYGINNLPDFHQINCISWMTWLHVKLMKLNFLPALVVWLIYFDRLKLAALRHLFILEKPPTEEFPCFLSFLNWGTGIFCRYGMEIKPEEFSIKITTQKILQYIRLKHIRDSTPVETDSYISWK